MATVEDLFSEFNSIEQNVLVAISANSGPCPGPFCDTRFDVPPGYKCVPCGTGPNQGYLSRDTGSDAIAKEIFSDILSEAENKLNGDTAGKYLKEVIKLTNLDVKVTAKINELNRLKELIVSMYEIINMELKNSGS
ncbi:MAG: hypothetical protein HGGPFJEG_02108 [Ignavibacteria bacterium]|nr:hypothetical protein [Ignavibacteria bacterium]